MLLLKASDDMPIALLPKRAESLVINYRRIEYRKKHKRKGRTPQERYAYARGIWKVNYILDSLARDRGYNSEYRVQEALDALIKDGLIKGYERIKHWASLDRQGVDFIVIKLNGSKIGIQVKSSKRKAQEFAEKRRLCNGENSLHIKVHIVVVLTDYTQIPQLLVEELKKIIQRD